MRLVAISFYKSLGFKIIGENVDIKDIGPIILCIKNIIKYERRKI